MRDVCLAVPMRIERVDGTLGQVLAGGVRREVRLDLVESPRVGDYVLVHAGYAIQLLDEQEALETLALLDEVLSADPPPPRDEV